jgi:ubiquinone/menaquinone biosynthesis C-methylase UbiE
MNSHHELTRAKYRQHAPWYNSVAAPLLGASYQREAVSLLHLSAGDAVVDVACGTGSNFPLIEQEIRHTGHLIGVDLSPEMLRQARARVVSHGWTNVTLINAPAEEVQIHDTVNAFLFSFAHDVLQSSYALRNLLQYATPGTSVAACGIKWAPWWNLPLNLLIFQIARQYHTLHAGLSEPWGHLAAFVSNLEIKLRAFEMVYVACGTLNGFLYITIGKYQISQCRALNA